MHTHIHTSEEIEKLRANPYVLKCSEKSITYTYEFKKRAVELYRQGVSSGEIWRRSGFDLSRWRKTYAKDCLRDWREIVEKKGYEGLAESRGLKASGRPKTKGVTDTDRIKRLELQVRYLRAENDFLIKLRAKRAESNSSQNKNTRSSKN